MSVTGKSSLLLSKKKKKERKGTKIEEGEH